MSEQGNTELRRQVVVAHPLAVVAAAFHQYMAEQGVDIRYEQIHFGGAFFVLYTDYSRENEVGTILIQAATSEKTLLEVFTLPEPSSAAESRNQATRLILAYFILWLENRYNPKMDRIFEETKQYMVELAAAILPLPENMKTLLGTRPGRNTDKDNDWARRQLALGSDPERIFEQWAQRKGYDLNDAHSRRKARNNFRQLRRPRESGDEA